MSRTRLPSAKWGPWGWLSREIFPLLERVDRRALVVLVASAAIIILFKGHGTVSAYHRYFGDLISDPAWARVAPNLYWFISSVLGFFLVPLAIAKFGLRVPIRETGLGFGDWRLGLICTLVLYIFMLPFVFGASLFEAFAHQYPLCSYVGDQAVDWLRHGHGHLLLVLSHEAGYALYFVGWEFLFRGFMTVVLARYIGPVAILVQMVPFAILHVGKPEAEALGSIVAGLALGVLALKTRSMLWGCLLHIMVALSMDVFVVLARLRRE